MVEPLSEEERVEMIDLARSRWDLLPTADRERLEELRRRDIDAHDDRVPVSIEFPPDEGS